MPSDVQHAANPHRGEETVHVGESTYTLRLTINSLCALEAEAGEPLDAMLAQLQAGRFTAIRLMFWAALLDRHSLTVVEAGDVLHDLVERGGMAAATGPLVSAIEASFGAPAEAAGANPPRPTTRRRKPKIGVRSSAA